MKIKYKLSIWIILIMNVVAAVMIILLLRQASEISLNTSARSVEYLTGRRPEFPKGREDCCIQTLHTLANIMGDYEAIQAEKRRDSYDDLLKSVMEAEPQLVLLYTVWKPNAIDGMDEQFIGRIGSSPTGQYATIYSKETGIIVKQVYANIEGSMAYITGPNARKDRIDNPMLLKINGNDKYVIRMMVPVTNNDNGEVVGALGCLLVIDVIQKALEDTIKTNDEITLMAVYSEDGTILAHFKPERIGRNMLDVDVELGDSRRRIFEAIKNGEVYDGLKYDPQLDENIRFVVKPVKTGGFNLTALIGVSESHILREIKSVTKFSVTMAAIAVLVIAAIIPIILGFSKKPLVTVTDTLKDIPAEQVSIKLNRINGISVKNRENAGKLVREASLLKAA